MCSSCSFLISSPTLATCQYPSKSLPLSTLGCLLVNGVDNTMKKENKNNVYLNLCELSMANPCSSQIMSSHGSIGRRCPPPPPFPLPPSTGCLFRKPSEMDLKLLPLPPNQPASVCCDLVDQIQTRRTNGVRDCFSLK